LVAASAGEWTRRIHSLALAATRAGSESHAGSESGREEPPVLFHIFEKFSIMTLRLLAPVRERVKFKSRHID
jgi:hypothetical protein